jgi:hypothetical protein
MESSVVTAKPVARAVIGSVREFVAAHGGSATAVPQPIGEAGVRVTLVGADGILGDRVVADLAAARQLVAAVDGLVESGEWTRELISTATPRPGHWAKMAGWVARQTRFPKARNAAVAG